MKTFLSKIPNVKLLDNPSGRGCSVQNGRQTHRHDVKNDRSQFSWRRRL